MPASKSKKLLVDLPSADQMLATLRALSEDRGSDQSVALLSIAYLDNALLALLALSFRPLTTTERGRMFSGSDRGILGTISAKIRVSYAMRLIEKQTYDTLLRLNDIRNAFAHSMHHVDFSNDLVAADCAALYIKPSDEPMPEPSARQRFILCTLETYVGLHAAVKKQATIRALIEPPRIQSPG